MPVPSPKSSSKRPCGATAALRAKAPTKDGITSGSTNTTRSTFRPGRSVRAASHAKLVPSTAHVIETVTANSSVRSSGPIASSDTSTSSASSPKPNVRTSR